MRIVQSIAQMQRLALGWRRRGVRVAMVPTMGYLHEGHLSLVALSRKRVGSAGKIVVSIYVNPLQFGPTEDLARYPRDLARDTKLCREAGVDLLFVPRDREMYRRADPVPFSTHVVETRLSQVMEGVSRPTHFRGVTTVVAKLLNLVQPDLAVFGAKDFQQAAIIQQMVRDLNFPTGIVIGPTVREADGLAMSSRNQYLSAAERAQAAVLWKAIQFARKAVRESRRPIPSRHLKAELRKLISRCPAARVDYLELFDPETLRRVTKVGPGTHLALAVFIGRARLIDNARL